MTKRRVVVTGLGVVSPLGNTVPTTWQALISGKSGVGQITRFDASDFATHIAAEVKDFNPELAMDAKLLRKVDLFIQFAIEAARQAVEDSGITISEANADRAGVAVGAGIGGLPWIEKTQDTFRESGARRISPFFIPGTIVNMAPGLISMKYGLKGPNLSIVTACTTGAHNIGFGARLIQNDEADIMVVGGSEMTTTPLGIGGFASAKALSRRNDDPARASRPWDKDRDGFVLGEGAGVLILEEYEHARKRGAKIYAELVGFGMSGDAYHMTAPDPSGRGPMMTMKNALKDAKMSPEQINYINAHATSTQAMDTVELTAVRELFGDHATSDQFAVSGTKSMTGHMLGAAGSAEAIFTVLAIHNGILPPTINLDNPEDICAGMNMVAHEAQEMKIKAALTNSFGFGGTNGSLIFKAI